MRMAVLVAAVVAFVTVAGLTVHLQVRAVLRSYQVGWEQEELHWQRQEVDRVRVRVDEKYPTPLVHQRARELRELRNLSWSLLAL